MPGASSFQSFRECIRDAARHWFDLVLKSHAAETIYAFALFTDDDGTGICHAANSEEGLTRKVAETLRRHNEPVSLAQLAQYRWCTSEWAHEDGGRGFPALNQFDVNRLRQEEAKKDDDFFFRFKTFRAMIGALGDLDREGVFGIGKRREGITVLVSVTDSAIATAVEVVSVRKLNPPVVVNRFLDDFAVRSMLVD